VQVPCAQVVGPDQPVPPHCPHIGAPVPPDLEVVVVVREMEVVVGVREIVVVVGVREMVVVVVGVIEIVVVVDETCVVVLVENVVLIGMELTDDTDVPEDDIVPVNRMSLELEPT
jgi:hypothetical protein